MEASDVDVSLAFGHGVFPWLTRHFPEFKMPAIGLFAENRYKLEVGRRISKKLGERGIEVVFCKGVSMMTNYYDEPALRPIGDVDFWIDHKDVYRAYEILTGKRLMRFDYRTPVINRTRRPIHLPQFIISGVTIELHYDFEYAHLPYPFDFASHIVEGKDGFKHFDAPLTLQYMTSHIGYHKYDSVYFPGSRMSWFLDLAVLVHKSSDPVGLCREAIALAPKQARRLKRIWSSAFSLLPEEEQKALEGALKIRVRPFSEETLSPGRKFPKYIRLYAGYISKFSTEAVRFVREKRKLSVIVDIFRDLIDYNKNRHQFSIR